MAMNGGIDQQINQKVDAYRGNPQQLMQRYQQNQQLVDLLALQKLKTEKEAAARDMQMKMQQQPQTIAQQREQEVLGLTKDELAQQTQGILQKRQQDQQQNVQKVAQGGLGALAGAPNTTPKMAGGGIVAFAGGGLSDMGGLEGISEAEIAAFRKSSPDTTPKMAGGGIVAFAGGGLSDMGGLEGISEAEIAAFRKSSPAYSRLPDAQIAKLLKARRPKAEEESSSVGQSEIEDWRKTGPSRMGGYGDKGIAEIIKAKNPERYFPNQNPAEFNKPPTVMAPEVSVDANVAAPQTYPDSAPPGTRTYPDSAPPGTRTYPDSAPPGTGIAALEGAGAPTSTPTAETMVKQGLASVGGGTGGDLGTSGMRGAKMQAQSDADAYLGRGEKADRFAAMQARLEALDAAQMDPEKLRREQLSSFLRGTANRGSFGSVMAGGSDASEATRRNQEASQRKRLLDSLGIEQMAITQDVELGKAGLNAGVSAEQQYAANQRQASAAASALGAAGIRAAVEEAKMLATKNENELQRKIDAEVRQAAAEADAAKNTIDRQRIATDLTNKRVTIADAIISNDPELTAAMQQAAQTGSPEAKAAVQARMDQLNIVVNAITKPLDDVLATLGMGTLSPDNATITKKQ
jgi:hypothetical protein